MKSVYWNKIPVPDTADGFTGSGIQCVPGKVSTIGKSQNARDTKKDSVEDFP